MSKPVRKTDIEVSKDDQVSINKFSKFNNIFHEKGRDLKKSSEFNAQLQDAITELELADDEKVRVRFGDCFFAVSVDEAKEQAEKQSAELSTEIAELKHTVNDAVERMKKLKAMLYGKFGDSIHLEED